jgi:hypothetical protein
MSGEHGGSAAPKRGIAVLLWTYRTLFRHQDCRFPATSVREDPLVQKPCGDASIARYMTALPQHSVSHIVELARRYSCSRMKSCAEDFI